MVQAGITNDAIGLVREHACSRIHSRGTEGQGSGRWETPIGVCGHVHLSKVVLGFWRRKRAAIVPTLKALLKGIFVNMHGDSSAAGGSIAHL